MITTVTLVTGNYNISGGLVPSNLVTWGDLGSVSTGYGTWTTWTNWIQEQGSIEYVLLVDMGRSLVRLPTIELNYVGNLSITLKIADAYDSNGMVDATTYNLGNGLATAVVAGRYYEYTIAVTPDSTNDPIFINIPEVRFDVSRSTEIIENVDTATLGGTIDAREVTVTQVSTVVSCFITAKEAGTTYSSGLLQDRVYAVPDDYVFQENAIIGNVVSLDPLTIRCFDLNGESIDAIVDIMIVGTKQLILTDTGVISI